MADGATTLPSQDPPDLPERRAFIGILAVGAFTTALNITLLSPLLLAIATAFSVSPAAAGQLVTLTAACSGLTALVVAPWMDRYSRAFWLRLECSLLAIGTLLSALAPHLGVLFLGRAIAGIGGAVIGATCMAACGDLFANPHQRNRALGLIGTALTLGGVVGLPLVTLIAERVDWRWAIAVPAPLAALVVVSAGQLPHRSLAPEGSPWRAWVTGYHQVLGSRETLGLLMAELGLTAVWFGWLIYFGAFAASVFAVSAGFLSALFLIGGVAQMLGNNLAPWMLRRWSPRVVGVVASGILTVNLLLVGVVYDQPWTLILLIAMLSAGCAMLFLCLSVVLLDSLPTGRGAVMSLQSAGLQLGGALGVALTGVGLAIFRDYETVYRLLGLVMPLVAVILWRSARWAGMTPSVP